MACIIDAVKARLEQVMKDGASPYLESLDTLKKNVQAGTVVEINGNDFKSEQNWLSVYDYKAGKQFSYEGKHFSSIEGAYKYGLIKKAQGESAAEKFYQEKRAGTSYRKNEGHTAKNTAKQTLREDTIDEKFKLEEMEKVLMSYFTANPNAKQMLLDTGNRTVKHKYGAKDTSPQVYNKVIGKVRDTLLNGPVEKKSASNVTLNSTKVREDAVDELFQHQVDDIKNKIC